MKLQEGYTEFSSSKLQPVQAVCVIFFIDLMVDLALPLLCALYRVDVYCMYEFPNLCNTLKLIGSEL